jgi:hypothetical protein
MSVAASVPFCDSVVDTMVQLALARRSHRIIAAGAASFSIYRGLCSRGFARVATIASFGAASAQHDVALVAGQHSLQALQELLLRLVPLLCSQGTIAVWIDCAGRRRGKEVQLLLERLGFYVESGAKCESGFVLAARRRDRSDLAYAA